MTPIASGTQDPCSHSFQLAIQESDVYKSKLPITLDNTKLSAGLTEMRKIDYVY